MAMKAFIQAVVQGNEKLIRRGCESGLVNLYDDYYGWPAAMYVLCPQNLHVLEILVEYGANLNIVTKYSGSNLLMIACLSYNDINQNVVKYLIENGANPSTINNSKCTSAHYAVESNNPKCLQLEIGRAHV